jgi:hypothetical protein
MASWIVHLRVAEYLLGKIPQLDEAIFAIGNIAPDSGIPDENWEHFNPPAELTHFKPEEPSRFRCADLHFFQKHLLPMRGKEIDLQRFSFLLGYFFHLLTDNNWGRRVGRPTMERYAERFAADRLGMWDSVKKDWYGLDHVYVRENPDSLFWRVFLGCHYERHDLDFLPIEAVQQRIAYIQEYFQNDSEEIREMMRGPFVYLMPQEMDAVVDETADLCIEAYRVLWVEGQDGNGKVSALEIV